MQPESHTHEWMVPTGDFKCTEPFCRVTAQDFINEAIQERAELQQLQQIVDDIADYCGTVERGVEPEPTGREVERAIYELMCKPYEAQG